MICLDLEGPALVHRGGHEVGDVLGAAAEGHAGQGQGRLEHRGRHGDLKVEYR